MATLQKEDIASKLLHSSDARIAEAAKRVFSTTYLYPASTSVVSSVFSSPPDPLVALAKSAPLELLKAESTEREIIAFPTTAVAAGLSLHNDGNSEHSAVGEFESVGLSLKRHDSISFLATSFLASAHSFGVNENLDEKKATERLQRRSRRERNRMHARKTRQRKKEHMQKLQDRADELKLEQIRLKQAINEKNTASILVCLFSTGDGSDSSSAVDPLVDALLKRPTEDIPDASKIPELPALILPGQHSGKKKTSSDGGCEEMESLPSTIPEDASPEDGIDYALLGKDRSACTPAELDRIRRERNRMHAKRTRDRKRIFMEEMEVMIKQLEEENVLLQEHAGKLNLNKPWELSNPPVISPELRPADTPAATPSDLDVASQFKPDGNRETMQMSKYPEEDSKPQHWKGDFLNQIESLLAAAGAFEKRSCAVEINAVSCEESDVTSSTNQTDQTSDDEDSHRLSGLHPIKKQCIERLSESSSSVPLSITTTTHHHPCV